MDRRWNHGQLRVFGGARLGALFHVDVLEPDVLRGEARVAASTTLTVEECDKAMDGIVCERWHKYRGFGKAKGRLDLSEAPQAYKDIEDVIASERDLVEPLVRLVPLASLKG